MRRGALRNLLTAIVIVLIVVSAYGSFAGGKDRMRLTKIEEKRLVTLIVTVPDANDSYYWLQIYGCAALVDENGVRCDPAGWWGPSGRQASTQTQYLIPFRDAPRVGTLHFTAFVADRFGNRIASATLTFMRGL